MKNKIETYEWGRKPGFFTKRRIGARTQGEKPGFFVGCDRELKMYLG